MGIRIGVSATVERTRAASLDELVEQASARIRRMLRAGTTTVESKSGYGLSTEAELKLLRVEPGARRGDAGRRAVDVPRRARLPSGRASRGLPADHRRRDDPAGGRGRAGRVRRRVVRRRLLHGAASRGTSSRRPRRPAWAPKIHADAYSYVGGSDLAAEMRMASVDHLNYTPRRRHGPAGGERRRRSRHARPRLRRGPRAAVRRSRHDRRRDDPGAGHRSLPRLLGRIPAVRHGARLSSLPDESRRGVVGGDTRRRRGAAACRRTAGRSRPASLPTSRSGTCPATSTRSTGWAATS